MAIPENLFKCPKCERISGDDWRQCAGSCPVKGSPHFKSETLVKFGPLQKMTRDQYLEDQEEKYRMLASNDAKEIPF